MALQYNTNQGRKRPLVLALEHAYHGDTFKAMEVGDDEDYHFAFDKKEGVVHIPTEIPALEEAFEQYHDRLNCFIVEPLLQGAGGMRMYDISFLKRARELCDQYDVLLIFDEVATGFGRTGNRFVADLVLPDILVLGKALTGGYIGHAVTVANHKVFDAFYSDDDRLALMHGPTFMGNPLACAVALKGIEIFEREDYMSKIRHIEQVSRGEMEAFTDPRIKEVRIMGGCVCVEVHDSRDLEGFQQFAYERGVFSRPFFALHCTGRMRQQALDIGGHVTHTHSIADVAPIFMYHREIAQHDCQRNNHSFWHMNTVHCRHKFIRSCGAD